MKRKRGYETIMITAELIELMPVGRVLKRWQTPRGQHQKMRVVLPVTYNVCDTCDSEIMNKSVKTEMGGSRTVLAQCPTCAAKELNDDGDS